MVKHDNHGKYARYSIKELWNGWNLEIGSKILDTGKYLMNILNII